MQTFRSLLVKIAATLDRENIPYIVIGGQAVMLYGEPRITKDIDITLGLDVDSLPRIEKIAREMGFRALIDNVDTFVRSNSILPLTDQTNTLRIDFIFSFMPYEREAIARAKRISIDGTAVSYACIEDVIIYKIFAGRPRDIEDVKGILNKNTTIDREMVLRWLEAFSETVGRDLTTIFKDVEKK